MKKRNSILKEEKIWLFISVIICFLVHAITANQLNGWFCTDTDGYWLHAATFTGHDWSGVASKVSMFYSWGYSVVLAIPFLITSDILVLSKITVAINSLFCALTIPLLYSIGKKIFADTNKKVIGTAAFITSLYPAYFLNSAVALTETFVYFQYVLLVWLVLHYLETGKKHWAVLASLCCGYLYITHHRNLGMVAAFVVFGLVLFVRKRDWKALLCFVIPLVLMFCIDSGVNGWLNAREMAGNVYHANTYSSAGAKVAGLLSLKKLIYMIQSALGEVWYLLAGTFLIAGVGIMHVVRYLFDEIKNINNKFLIYAYMLLNIVFMMGVSVVFCTRGTNVQNRMDTIFYGRYFECTLSFMIFLGLLMLAQIRKQPDLQKDIKLLLLLFAVLSMCSYFFTQEIAGSDINYFSVAAVLFPFSYPNVAFSVLPRSIFTVAVAVLIFYLLLCKEVRYRVLSYVLIGGCFLYVGYSALINTRDTYENQALMLHYPMYNIEFDVMNSCIGGLNPEELYICTTDGYDAFSYQLYHPEMRIVTISSVEEAVEEMPYVLASKELLEDYTQYDIVMETPNYILYRMMPD